MIIISSDNEEEKEKYFIYDYIWNISWKRIKIYSNTEMITLILLFLYQDKFIDEIIFSSFYITIIWIAIINTTNIFGSNKIVYLVKHNITAVIHWSIAVLAKRWSFIFDENDKMIEF